LSRRHPVTERRRIEPSTDVAGSCSARHSPRETPRAARPDSDRTRQGATPSPLADTSHPTGPRQQESAEQEDQGKQVGPNKK
jgi:hypothetical protein